MLQTIQSQLVFTITEKAPTRAFSWMKAPTSAFTFKTLLRHYAKRALTPRSLNVKLGPRHNYHKGRAAIRHYANQPTSPLWLLRWRPNFTSTYRGPSRGLLRDCTTSPMDRFTTLSYFIEAVNQKRTRFFDRQSIVGTKNCCHVPPSQLEKTFQCPMDTLFYFICHLILHIVFCRTTFKQQTIQSFSLLY